MYIHLIVIKEYNTAILIPKERSEKINEELAYCSNQSIEINSRKERASKLIEELKTFKRIKYDYRN